MLDIGDGAGALVVYASEALLDEEIEIKPHDAVWTGLHTAVRARHLGEIVRYAGVFGSLAPGLYDLRVRPSHRPHSPGSHSPGSHSHGSHSHGSPVADRSANQTVTVTPARVVETRISV